MGGEEGDLRDDILPEEKGFTAEDAAQGGGDKQGETTVEHEDKRR